MKKLFEKYLRGLSRPAGITILVILQGVFMAAFHGLFPFSVEKIKQISGGLGIPDARIYYDFNQLQEMLSRYGATGREMYLRLQWIDMFYPLVYASLFAVLLYWLYNHTRLYTLVVLPFVAAAFDYAENILLRISVESFPHLSRGVVNISGVVTYMKWLLLFFTFFLLIFGVIWKTIRYFRYRQKRAAG
jgi:hypothetical protein